MTAPAEKPPPYSLCHFEIYPGRSPLNEAAWKRLLSQIRGACVVPVIGPELLVGRGGWAAAQDCCGGDLSRLILR